jgi:hypothetical protein
VTRGQLEHLIRAAADLTGDDEIVIVGSQAILGAHPDAPGELLVSMEADLYPLNRPERADVIDGTIGEGSPFHETFGYYGQGVGPETATLPDGWSARLVRIRNDNTRGATGLALEPHDLVIWKFAAGRAKDRDFVRAAAAHRLVSRATLAARLESTPALDDVRRARIRAFIDADLGPGAGQPT